MIRAPRQRRPPTRELILKAAERLFAIHGIEAVSLRQIGVEAGQRRTGVVQYHFGTKDEVVQALFEMRLTVINDRQLTLYDKVKSEGRLEEPRAAVEMIVLPLADELDTDSSFLGVAVRVRHYPEDTLPYRALAPDLTAGIRRVGRLTSKHVRSLPPQLRRVRRDTVAAAVLTALSDRQLAMREGTGGLVPTELFLSELIDAATAWLTAPSSTATTDLISPRRRR